MVWTRERREERFGSNGAKRVITMSPQELLGSMPIVALGFERGTGDHIPIMALGMETGTNNRTGTGDRIHDSGDEQSEAHACIVNHLTHPMIMADKYGEYKYNRLEMLDPSKLPLI